jgi:hypothetical protein
VPLLGGEVCFRVKGVSGSRGQNHGVVTNDFPSRGGRAREGESLPLTRRRRHIREGEDVLTIKDLYSETFGLGRRPALSAISGTLCSHSIAIK